METKMETFTQSDQATLFSDRMSNVPRSFIREILKVTNQSHVISFAGGLPNPKLFPVEELKICADTIFRKQGSEILQYSNSEGYAALKEKIAFRYKLRGMSVLPENILITNGSQQALDLLGKIFINEGDPVIIEEPGYLGAIQAFSTYRAKFNPIGLSSYGLDLAKFEEVIKTQRIKFAYLIPNFQNPSGNTYSTKNRKEIAEIIEKTQTFLIEDDPYGDLRFKGERQKSFYEYIPDKTILLGTFSKTVVPSFRIGWIVAPGRVMEKLLIAKQAADLHTNFFSQCLLNEYLENYNLDEHLLKIREAYKNQADQMIRSIEMYFPNTVTYTTPEGGMFLWVTLPERMSSLALFNRAINHHVAFVPGDPFYIQKSNVNTLRLNYTCSSMEEIDNGIGVLGSLIA